MAKQSLSELARANRQRDEACFAVPSAQSAPRADDGARHEWIVARAINPNRFQPRKNVREDELLDLVSSIDEQGQEQAIGINRTEDGDELIYGQRRTLAVVHGANARGKGAPDAEQYKGKVLARVYENLTDVQILEKAIEENARRADVPLMDLARSLKQLRELLSQEKRAQGLLAPDEWISWRELEERRGASIGLGYRQMHRIGRLCELPDEVQTLIENGLLKERQSRSLVSLLETPSEAAIPTLATRIVRLRLTGDMADKAAKKIIESAQAAPDLELPVDELLDDAQTGAAQAGADDARELNKRALDEGRAHLSLVTSGKDAPTTPFAQREEDGRVVAVPVPAPEAANNQANGNRRWAKAIINARLQPAALMIAGARDSFALGEWAPYERKLMLAALDEIQMLLDAAKKEL